MSKGNRKRRRKAGLLPTPERCSARNRFGEPCKKYPVEGAVVCASHGGAAPQVKRKAQERMAMAQDDAASLIVRALSDPRIPFSERRKCAEYLLNYEHRNDVKVTLEKWQENIEGLLVDVPDEPEVIDAEIVEEPAELTASSAARWPDERLPSVMDDPPNGRRGTRVRGR